MKKLLLLSIFCFSCFVNVYAVSQPHFTGKPEFIKFDESQMPDITQLYTVLNGYGFSQPSALTLINTETDALGMVNYRFRQTFNGYPVDETMLIVHTNNGKIQSMNGLIYSTPPSLNTIVLSQQAAHTIALNYLPATTYNNLDTTVQLYMASPGNITDGGSFRLCYRFDIYAANPLARKYIFVDVTTGTIITTHDLINEGNATGTAVTAYSGTQTITTDSYNGGYRLRETGRGGGIQTYDMNKGTDYGSSTDFTDADNYWNNVNANLDQYATDAHWGAEETYDYYFKTYNRNSVDNAGLTLKCYVHYSVEYLNAFWDGTEMTFGDGSPGYTPLTALDITGHEISHGVTQYTAALDYAYESGALNEAFSDCMGTTIEFYGKPATANWTMGEDIGTPFRNLANPKQYQQPDTYLGQYWYTGNDDNGGVHTNSGVMNYWYYLVSMGGTGTNDLGNSYNVTGITIAKASAITYRMQSVYLFPTAQYADARTYSIQAALDLYGPCSPEVIAVTNAWYAVGVGGTSSYTKSTVSITATPGNIICPGTNVTFNALPVNAGSSPIYQWKLNGANAGTNSASYSNSTLVNNDNVTCIMSVNSACGNSIDTSNTITIIENPGVAVTISSDFGSNTCGGMLVTFIATPVNGGSAPVYQWQVNGVNVGTNSPHFSTSSLANGDNVSCTMVSNAPCAIGNPANSNVINMSVSPGLALQPGVVGIDALIASGQSASNFGHHPNLGAYTWTCGGSLCLSRGLVEFDLSSLPPGATIQGAYLSLYADKNSPQGYTGQPTYGTDNAAWLRRITAPWTENGVTWDNQPAYTTTNEVAIQQSASTAENYINLDVTSLIQDMVTNGNYGFMIMDQNETTWYNSLLFASGDNADSSIHPRLQICYLPNPCTPLVTISASPGNVICPGNAVNFTAAPLNAGPSPSYQWKVNGANVGTNNSSYVTSALSGNDKVTCVVTSNQPCSNGVTATSNTVTIIMNPTGPVSVAITSDQGAAICVGSTVNFTATPVNGGTLPSYQWQVNGVNVGTNSSTYSTAQLSNNDQVSCIITSSSPCATGNPAVSNTIVVAINPGLVLQPGAAGKDVMIASGASTTNYNNSPFLGSFTWTCSGDLCLARGLVEFDLSSLPPGATIQGAYLSLYADKNATSGYSGQPTYGTDNAAWIRRVTAPWTESSVTWDNQPAYTTTNQVAIQQSTSTDEDYINLDVTSLIQDMVTSGNYGFMIMDQNETTYYNSLLFGSGDNADSTLHPKLQICYLPSTCVPAVVISANPGNTLCTGQSAVFSAIPVNGGAAPSYQWQLNGSNVGTNSSTYSPLSLSNGDNVICKMTSNATCAQGDTATSNAISITVTPAPSSFNVTGGGAYCTVPGTGLPVGLSNSQTGVNYQLVYNGTVNVGPALAGNGSSLSFGNQVAAGSYRIVATYATGGCSLDMTGSASIFVNPSPTITVGGPAVFCFGDSVLLTSSPGSSYVWNTGEATQAIYAASTGAYYVTVNNCVSPDEMITVDPVPQATITPVGPTSVCNGNTVTLNAATTGLGITFQWQENDVNISNATSPAYVATTAGMYELIEKNSLGCTGGDSIKITEVSLDTLTIVSNRDTICNNGTAVIESRGAAGPYQWQSSATPGNFTNIAGANSSSLSTTITKTTYFRLVSSGPCADTSNVLKEFFVASPVAVFSYSAKGTLVTFNSDSSVGAVSYHWDFGDSSTISFQKNPTHTYSKDSSYACLTVYNGSNCSYTYCSYIDLDVTGVANIPVNFGVRIYPNPTDENVTIEVNNTCENCLVEITNVLGQTFYSQPLITNKSVVDVSKWAAGIYFIHLHSGNAEVVRKLIKD